MTTESRAELPPGPTYEYGGHSVWIVPDPDSTTRWRVMEDDGYLGTIATADAVKGEPEVHFAVHFAGEEDIPPTKIVPLWTTAAEFLIDAGEPQRPPAT
ncbi:hypothetical protein ACRAWC_09715 [Leifsonia sp. L25]|uniref:hypothetical protein n=1 Tax=Actinomycetes TaxID=1760 RepID=UPI003D697E6D